MPTLHNSIRAREKTLMNTLKREKHLTRRRLKRYANQYSLLSPTLSFAAPQSVLANVGPGA